VCVCVYEATENQGMKGWLLGRLHVQVQLTGIIHSVQERVYVYMCKEV